MSGPSFVIETPAEVAIAGVAYAEANWGRWVARCVRPWCTNAIALEPGQVEFLCLGGPDACGYSTVVIWPPDPQAIEAILGMRPVRRTQNWLPGEHLEDLLAENAAHDCLPPEWKALTERTLILHEVEGVAVDGLLLDVLPAADPRRQLRAARALAHDHDLPFVEPDGTLSFSPHPELEG
jgi:hypothetical protein